MRNGRPARAWPGLIGLCGALAAAGCGGAASPTAPVPTPVPTPSPSPKVVIVSVDGLRPDVFSAVELPSLSGLARRGVFTWKARTVRPSETLPAHSSMLSGQEPKLHTITWDDDLPERGDIPVPTVFSVAKAAGLRTVMVVGKRKLRHIAVAGTVDAFVLSESGDADVANEAIVQAGIGFDLMFVHFPDVDLAGHAEGWMSAPYLAKAVLADEAIGRLLAALPPQATVLFTSDHGGRGTNHGPDVPENTTVPWILAGPRVLRRGELTRAIKETDTAATALFVLGLKLPDGCPAEVVSEAFGTP